MTIIEEGLKLTITRELGRSFLVDSLLFMSMLRCVDHDVYISMVFIILKLSIAIYL